MYWACFPGVLSDPIRLVSGEFRGQVNISGSLSCFLVLSKLFLQGSAMSLCRNLLVRGVVLLYCMAVRESIGLQVFRKVSK